MDELLEMSRKMQERLDQLRHSHIELTARLSRGVEDLKGVLGAAEDAMRAR